MATFVQEQRKQFLGVESFPDLDTVQSLTIPPGCNFVELQAQASPVLLHPGGETPTEGASFVVGVNELWCVHTDNLADIRIIKGGPSARVFAAYYR